MQQWDASRAPQANAFRPSDNSPFGRHFTHKALLCVFVILSYHETGAVSILRFRLLHIPSIYDTLNTLDFLIVNAKENFTVTRIQRLRHNLIGDRAFYGQVVSILIPLIIQNTVTNVVSLVDNVMIGAVGTLQMSAVAIVNQLLFIFNLCIFGGLAGAGIFAVQYAGAKDINGIRYCFRMKNYIAVAMLVIAGVVFTVFPKELISMYLAEGTSAADAQATLQYGMEYFMIMLVGLVPFAVSQSYGSTLREMGETKLPMVASILAILINLIFNYILIFGNEGLAFLWFGPMGVAGAAIATVLSRFVEAAVIVIFTHVKKQVFPFIIGAYRSLRIPLALFRDIVKKDAPLLINEFLWSLGVAMTLQCYSVRGLDVVAASNISSTISNLFNVIFLSMGNALAIVVGQHLGANEIKEAKLSVSRIMALSIASCVIMGLLMALCAPFIPEIYNTTPEVKQMATEFLWIVSLMMPLFSFSHCCYFTMRSGGKTFITMCFDCGFTWLVSFPTAFVLANFTDMPIVPLYLIVQSLEIIKVVLGFILLKKGVWINNIVRTVD